MLVPIYETARCHNPHHTLDTTMITENLTTLFALKITTTINIPDLVNRTETRLFSTVGHAILTVDTPCTLTKTDSPILMSHNCRADWHNNTKLSYSDSGTFFIPSEKMELYYQRITFKLLAYNVHVTLQQK
jgi:hypothetical protein